MQDSNFFPLFSRHQDPMASMIKTSKISLLICSPLVNIGWLGWVSVGAVEDAGGADVEEDDMVAGAEVVLDGPFDGVGTLIA
ncbi:hypothetical protein CMV_018360 [Castanea mollissima]|uniref:Uncharacterized protein n=1 Tax=Castanea mollissima TaxID=60419 RepID=A0A8J4QNA4_9ROSI|nr:hypothetical protein CMV_018360 [Castanea mollissima]